MCPGLANLLVVEGGKRAVGRYKKLIQRRIKWKEAEADDDEEDVGDKQESAVLLWEGHVQKRQFDSYKIHNVKTETEARNILTARNCESYWTLLETFRDQNMDL